MCGLYVFFLRLLCSVAISLDSAYRRQRVRIGHIEIGFDCTVVSFLKPCVTFVQVTGP